MMANYHIGQEVLIKTSYRDKDGQFILAGRPGIIASITGGYWPEYNIEVQMPDGPCEIRMRQSTDKTHGILIDNPKNRARYPIPNWEQIDLEELHWPKLMTPTGIRVNGNAFGGFMPKIAEACGGIDTTETDMNVSLSYRWHADYARESELRTYIFPSEDRVKAFWQLLRWIEWYGKTKYGAGVEKGHNLLLQLNQGELTIDMFTKRVAEESRLNYEKNPWKEGS